MQATYTGVRPTLHLRRDKLDELRRANNIPTEKALADALRVDAATLWRATKGEPVSSGFVARVKLAFPLASIDSLFEVKRMDAVS